MKYKQFDVLLNLQNYSNKTVSGLGIRAGLYNYSFSEKWESDFEVNFWNQPETFYENSMILGGQIKVATKYYFKNNFAGLISLTGKTNGWTISNP